MYGPAADACVAEGSGALVADHVTGKKVVTTGPPNGCKEDGVPLAVERWYDFRTFWISSEECRNKMDLAG
jgi:hypothetical protein